MESESKMENKENEDYKIRVKNLINRVEKDKDNNSLEGYQQLLEKMEEVKQSSISKINKSNRNNNAIKGFVYILREYFWLIADPKYPFEKGKLQEKIDSLYKLIYENLSTKKSFTLNILKYTP